MLNGAKEAALDAFIAGRIGFLDMAALVEHVVERLGPEAARHGAGYGLETVTALDAAARRCAADRAETVGATGARTDVWS